MSSSPKVSIILPVYNAQRYLKKAVDSLLNQTFKDFELLAINDGSTDRSLRILTQYASRDSRVRVLNQENQGLVSALNRGITESLAPYIARMDADDIAHPERLEKQINYLESHPECVALGSWVTFIDDAGLPFFNYQTRTEHKAILKEILQGNGGAMIHPSLMIRKQALVDLGGYEPNCKHFEDFDLYLKLINHGTFHNIPEYLLQYRRHFKSINFTKDAQETHAQKTELLNKFRTTLELPPVSVQHNEFSKDTSELYKHWAQWALSDDYRKSAIKYTLLALLYAPLRKHSWSFLSYALKQLCSKLGK